MITAKILLVLLSILFLLLISLLFIPFGYRLKIVCMESKSIQCSAYWFFGQLRYSWSYVLNQGSKGLVYILGFKKIVGRKDKDTVEIAGEARKKQLKKRKKTKKKRILSNEAIQYALHQLRRVLSHILPHRIEGHGRLGFQDPYYTGLTCSLLEILRSLHPHQLNLDYVFEDEVYEGEVHIEGRIFLFYIVYIAVRLYLNKSVRRLIAH